MLNYYDKTITWITGTRGTMKYTDIIKIYKNKYDKIRWSCSVLSRKVHIKSVILVKVTDERYINRDLH